MKLKQGLTHLHFSVSVFVISAFAFRREHIQTEFNLIQAAFQMRTDPFMTGGAQGVLRGLEQSAVETPWLGMGMNNENLHGLMVADSPSTLNSQPTIEQPGNKAMKH
jgi:hypothetical protein